MHGSSAGDLYVQVNVREHDIFQREGSDLYTEVPVAFAIAALGGDITVPTLSGAVKLKIPEETQSGKLFRLRGKGVKALRSGVTGDLLCRIIIETPIKLTAEQKDMLKKFDSSIQEAGKKHSPKSKNWLDSMKDFFKTSIVGVWHPTFDVESYPKCRDWFSKFFVDCKNHWGKSYGL